MWINRQSLPRSAASVFAKRIRQSRIDRLDGPITISFSFHESWTIHVQQELHGTIVVVSPDEKYRTLESFMIAYGLGKHECMELKQGDMMVTALITDPGVKANSDDICRDFMNMLKDQCELTFTHEEWSTYSSGPVCGTSTSFSLRSGDFVSFLINMKLEAFMEDKPGVYIQLFFPNENRCCYAGEKEPLITHTASVNTYIFHMEKQ